MYFRLWHGSVQSKVISILAVASIILTPLTPAAFGDGSPTVPNPVFTAQAEQPKVDGSTGAFTQQIPIDIPPGRNGLQPDVSLEYNSQRTQDIIVGYGWSLSIPYIQRLNKTGSQDLYTSNAYFTSSVDGDLVGSTTPPSSFPTILRAIPLTFHHVANPTTDLFSYTVPAGGNK